MSDATKNANENPEEVRAERDHLRKQLTLAENLGKLGTWVYDPWANEIELTESIRSLLGLEQSDGNRYDRKSLADDVYIAPERDRTREIVTDAVNNKTGFTLIHQIKPKGDAGIMWVRHTGEPILTDDGELSGFRGVSRDITEEINAYQARDRFLDELRDYRRDETVGYLASAMSHEVSNFLQPAMTFCALAREAIECGDYESTRHNVTKMESAMKRATSLLRSALEISRTKEEEFETLTVRGEMEYMPIFIDPTLQRRLEFDIHPDAEDAPLQATRLGIAQCMINLIRNAAQAAPKTGRIMLSSWLNEDGSELTWRTEDDGKGFTSDALAHAFDPLFTTKNKDQGTGLGLAVVKSIIERWGGRVEISNRPEGGGRVDVVLPVKDTANT